MKNSKSSCNKKCKLDKTKTKCESCDRTVEEITERGKNYIVGKGK